GVTSLLVGIFATWLFMYGLIPVFQGPIAVALGGWDLSWLAGGLASATSYAILGPRMHRKFLEPAPAATVHGQHATELTGASAPGTPAAL
ncbi:MAG: cytosine permease, partial [Actinomycetes bacterium]